MLRQIKIDIGGSSNTRPLKFTDLEKGDIFQCGFGLPTKWGDALHVVMTTLDTVGNVFNLTSAQSCRFDPTDDTIHYRKFEALTVCSPVDVVHL